jgi:hypothetical protein
MTTMVFLFLNQEHNFFITKISLYNPEKTLEKLRKSNENFKNCDWKFDKNEVIVEECFIEGGLKRINNGIFGTDRTMSYIYYI